MRKNPPLHYALLAAALLSGGCARDVANVQSFMTGSIEREHWVSAEALLERRNQERRARAAYLGYDADPGEPVTAMTPPSDPPAWSEPASSATAAYDSAPLPPIPQTTTAAIPVAEAYQTPEPPPRREIKRAEAPTPPPEKEKETLDIAAVSGPRVAPVAPAPEPEPLSIRDECLQRLADQYGNVDGPSAAAQGTAEKFETDALCELVLKRTAPEDESSSKDVVPAPTAAPNAPPADGAKPENGKPRALNEDEARRQTAQAMENDPQAIRREECLGQLADFYGKAPPKSGEKLDKRLSLDADCAQILQRTSDSNGLAPGWRSLREPPPAEAPPAGKINFAQRWERG